MEGGEKEGGGGKGTLPAYHGPCVLGATTTRPSILTFGIVAGVRLVQAFLLFV